MDKFKELLEECRKGDRASVETLLYSVRPLILSTVKKYCSDYSRRDDLIQDCCMVVLESIERFDPDKNVPYLGYIKNALRKCIWSRMRKRDMQSLNEENECGVELIECLAGPEMDILEYVEMLEEYRSLHEAINMLPKFQREVIICRYFKDMGISDIAMRTGKKSITVKKTRERAIKNLRLYLDGSIRVTKIF